MRHVAVDGLCRFPWTPARQYPYAGYETTPPPLANVGSNRTPGTVCAGVTAWARACVPDVVSPTGVSVRNVSRSRQFAKLGKLWRNTRVRRQPAPACDLRLRLLLFVVNDVRDKTTLEKQPDSFARRPSARQSRANGEEAVSMAKSAGFLKNRLLFQNTFSDTVSVRRELSFDYPNGPGYLGYTWCTQP